MTDTRTQQRQWKGRLNIPNQHLWYKLS